MKIYVDLDHVDITEYTGIESGEYNTNKINFIFTPEYKDLVKVAIFGCKLDTDEPKFYKIYLSDDSCYLPSEVTSASDVISIGVYAFNVENGELKLRYSPTPVKTIVYEGSFREEAENASSPTPTEIEQIMSRIISLEEITSDLNTRVEALENKACDLDSIKEDVDTLKSDVENISGRVDTIESDIDDLEGDIANTYSKTEVDTLLGNKVDTTTYNSGQAAQDEKIAKAELILSQLPKVTGEGTNISLSPTIEYDLEVDSYKGDTTQNTLNGYQLINFSTPSQITDYTTLTFQNDVLSVNCTEGSYRSCRWDITDLCKANAGSTLKFVYTSADVSNQHGVPVQLAVTNNGSTSYPTLLSHSLVSSTYAIPSDVSGITKIQFQVIPNNENTSRSASLTITKPMLQFGTTSHDYEQYCGGIPSPNPNYPQDIQVVTGTQTVTISNSDDTESQTYTLHLGDEELAKIGTYQDKIYYDNGKWYKYGAIGKKTLDNTMPSSVTTSASYGTICYLNFVGVVNDTSINAISDKFIGVSYNDRLENPTGYRVFTSTGGGVVTIRFPNNSDIDTLQEVKDFLANNITKVYYVLVTASITEITNETLLSDLEYIRTHAMSYSGTTNISSSGNLPIIISASALKQLS